MTLINNLNHENSEALKDKVLRKFLGCSALLKMLGLDKLEFTPFFNRCTTDPEKSLIRTVLLLGKAAGLDPKTMYTSYVRIRTAET